MLDAREFLQTLLAVLFEKRLVLFVFECVQLLEVFVFEPVFVLPFARGEDGFFDYGRGGGWLFGDYAVFAEDVIPIRRGVSCILLASLDGRGRGGLP